MWSRSRFLLVALLSVRNPLVSLLEWMLVWSGLVMILLSSFIITTSHQLQFLQFHSTPAWAPGSSIPASVSFPFFTCCCLSWWRKRVRWCPNYISWRFHTFFKNWGMLLYFMCSSHSFFSLCSIHNGKFSWIRDRDTSRMLLEIRKEWREGKLMHAFSSLNHSVSSRLGLHTIL